MELRVEQVAVEETLALRQAVLRPRQPREQLRLPDDDAPGTAHFAAYADGTVVGTASVRREPAPWAPDQPAWRLRGMATAAPLRGTGVGARVLAAAVGHVASAGGGTLWCNARTPARAFYERAGFRVVGDPWDDPEIGPHVQMTTEVEPR